MECQDFIWSQRRLERPYPLHSRRETRTRQLACLVAFIGVIHQHRHRPQAVQQFPAFWSISLVVRAGQTQKTPTVNG